MDLNIVHRKSTNVDIVSQKEVNPGESRARLLEIAMPARNGDISGLASDIFAISEGIGRIGVALA